MTSLRRTSARCSLGISMPTVFLPGIGATMRTLGTLQVQGEVVGQARDLVDAQARFQGDLVLRDDRAGVDADDADVEAEVGEGLFQQGGPFAELLIVLVVGERLRIVEQRQRRQSVFIVPARYSGRRMMNWQFIGRAGWTGERGCVKHPVFGMKTRALTQPRSPGQQVCSPPNAAPETASQLQDSAHDCQQQSIQRQKQAQSDERSQGQAAR